MEILLVVVVIGIIVMAALPQYVKAVERAKMRGALNSLMLVYTSQKRYKLDNGSYYSCQGTCSNASIYNALGITVDTAYFDYTIASTDPQNQDYTAEAIRKAGTCAGRKMIVTSGNGEINKECKVWLP